MFTIQPIGGVMVITASNKLKFSLNLWAEGGNHRNKNTTPGKFPGVVLREVEVGGIEPPSERFDHTHLQA
jgi:hypothetical protein